MTVGELRRLVAKARTGIDPDTIKMTQILSQAKYDLPRLPDSFQIAPTILEAAQAAVTMQLVAQKLQYM